MDFCNLFLFTWVIATTYALGYEGIDDGYDRYEHDEGYNEGYESNPAHYQYEYGVADPYTGDYHQQQEIREGEIVKGSYSLKEPDGSTRIVEYYAGPHTGFNAIVKKVGPSYHPYPYYAQGGIGYAQGYGGYDIGHYGLGKGIGYGYGYESPYGHVGVRYGY